jgi:sugar phosphate isomerase/epimerase
MKRSFSLVFIMLAILASGSLVSCKKAAKESLIGVQLYSLRDSMQANPVGMVEQVGKMGYKFVELYGYDNGKFFGMEPAEFKALVEKNGMYVLSSHSGISMPADSTKWNEAMAWWDKCIADHVAVGAKYIIQTWMDSLAYTSIANLQKQLDYFTAVAEKCKAAGITFGYHNEMAEYKELEGQIPFDYMLQHMDTTKFVFELDIWNMTEGGKSPVDYLKKYPGRFLLMHVKDEKELGASGKIDLPAIFSLSAGVKYFVVEVESYTNNPVESVKQCYDYLNNADFVK